MFTEFFTTLLNDFFFHYYKSDSYRKRLLEDIQKASKGGFVDTIEDGYISFKKIELEKDCGSSQLIRYDLRIHTDEIKGVIELGQHGYITHYNFDNNKPFHDTFIKLKFPEPAIKFN